MRARADLCFRPRLNRVRLLDWHKFDSVVQGGYESAMQDLALVDPAEIARFHKSGCRRWSPEVLRGWGRCPDSRGVTCPELSGSPP